MRSSATTAGAAQRARIVLLASRGVANALISELVGVSRPTVDLWRGRYLEHGLEGLSLRSPMRSQTMTLCCQSVQSTQRKPVGLKSRSWSGGYCLFCILSSRNQMPDLQTGFPESVRSEAVFAFPLRESQL